MPYRPDDCCCPPDCPARCNPGRLCDLPVCPCYQLWTVEIDELARQTANMSPEEIRRMAAEAWRDA